MRLKHVRVFGFKTFADRTDFSVDGDIVAVVGPNGCGKSNLVDAVLWGLGETNSRHLRAATNQDVIFNGSPRRKPVGFAEVSLTFDNEDRTLPIDANEVVVTRRITRGGDSDYSINKRACRLRDIYDLMSDSGLGRTGYSIVGQKEIDAALAASAEDRRDWIDEAAGVQRYRTRKNESLKRLDQANGHLDRVRDILQEITSQRDPLQAESDRAHRFKDLQAALREVEVGLLVREAVSARIQLEELQIRLTESSARRESLSLVLLEAEFQAQKIGAELSELELGMDELRAQIQVAITDRERARSAIQLAIQRLQALAEQETGIESDATAIAERITSATHDASQAENELAEAKAAQEELEKSIQGLSGVTKELRTELRNLDNQLNEIRTENQKRARARAEAAHASDRRRSAERELLGITDSLPALREAYGSADADLKAAEAAIAVLKTNIKVQESQATEIRDLGQKDQQRLNEISSQSSALEGKRRGIESTLDSLEGLSQGSRAVLEAAKAGILHAEFHAVGSVIEADKEIALAIETALGASSNDLIVDHDRDAKDAIQFLKERRAGRATFQPISLMRPVDVTHDLRQSQNAPGVIGRASQLVTSDRKFTPVIESLLGRILIVESLDAAIAMARTRGWSRLVTLEGEVVHSSGAVTGGAQTRTGYGLVQRRADLTQIEADLANLAKKREDISKAAGRNSASLTEIDQLLRSLRIQLTEATEDQEDKRRFARNVADEMKSTEQAQSRLERELAGLKVTNAELDEIEIESVQACRDVVAGQLLSQTSADSDANRRIEEANERVKRAIAAQSAAKKRLLLAQDEAQARTNRLQNLGPLRDKISAERDVHVKEEATHDQTATVLTEQLNQATANRKLLLEQSFAAAEVANEARKDSAIVDQGISQAEIARARAESRRAIALERLLEEYGLTSDDAEDQAPTVEVPDDASTVTNRLRRELKAMGEVNLGAIEAYQRLNERFLELDAQRQDVEEGITQVRATITELDDLTRDRFVSTYEAVKTAFSEVFLSVMGGGSGEIRLTDEANVLDSGIEIDITLPGKKRQPLSLLSGGERSLCATAFLFSLLKVKPSPLVILDEVDAPLDGRNVERFAALLQQFTNNTQFIVITHNPTTIECAPVWLGVTMQEPGVSSLIPARLKESKQMVAAESGLFD